jgi:hypothetical protein
LEIRLHEPNLLLVVDISVVLSWPSHDEPTLAPEGIAMIRERQAAMDKARAKRLRRAASSRGKKPAQTTETQGVTGSLRTLAGNAVEKLTDLAGLAANTARSVVGLEQAPVESSTAGVS